MLDQWEIARKNTYSEITQENKFMCIELSQFTKCNCKMARVILEKCNNQTE